MAIEWDRDDKAVLDGMLGKTFDSIDVGDSSISFSCPDGSRYEMYHEQDCCEDVQLDDIAGDLADLIGSPILMAEKVSEEGGEGWDSSTWTFYKFATAKGYVTLRWYGESNGYYSEDVSIRRVT